ncbi:hypothetical protein NA57DRAFT_72345 [Rhizodiscina lignyota]|uniref:NACHT domain-containing protein n=1 Tax=Rhizodiscina lignyota TaxID=1504668 RepID=A0A9P4IKS5_9PEZI|nr:hypothetical protein NA57DRAFT_72345 [Rhizodiscina lignyota]
MSSLHVLTQPESPARHLRAVPSQQARLSIKEAFDRLQKSVTKEDEREFFSTELEDVFATARDVERQLAARGELRNMRRIQPFFDWLLQYSKEMEILCNGTPYLPWVWAPIRLILHLASDFTNAIEKLIKAYGQIADCLPRLDRLKATFSANQDFQQVLAAVYADILLFHERAYKFVRRKGWKLFFCSSWTVFQSHFQTILDSIARHADLIDREAMALHISEARLWRQSAMDRALRLEQENLIAHSQAVMSWLKTSDVLQQDELDNQFEKGSPGTCEWVIRHSQMKKWIQPSQETEILWLKGKPGSGKTVLCANTIRFLKIGGSATVIYYFCNNYRMGYLNGLASVLQSLCSQLLEAEKALYSIAYEQYISKEKSSSIQNLSLLLHTLISTFDNVRIIIDGLDEWDSSHAQRMVKELRLIISKKEKNTFHKLLISSRELPHLNRTFAMKPVISLSDEREAIDSAIRSFADSSVSEIFKTLKDDSNTALDDRVQHDIQSDLVRKADGMFLWVRLVLGILERADSLHSLKLAVASFPRELGDVYGRILEDMRSCLAPAEYEKALRVLAWITFAKRPLRTYELQHGVTLHAGNTRFDHETRPLRNVYDICRPLIENGPHQTVVLIHSSVKEFLLEVMNPPVLNAITAQGLILFSCTVYLVKGYDLVDPAVPDLIHMQNLTERFHSLHHYCRAFWHEHLFDYATLTPDLVQDRSSTLALQLRLLCDVHRRVSEAQPFLEQLSDRSLTNDKLEQKLALLADMHYLHRIVREVLISRERSNEQRLSVQGANPAEDLSLYNRMHLKYEDVAHNLLRADLVDGLSPESLKVFKDCFAPSAFVCSYSGCNNASMGFGSQQELSKHEIVHGPRFRCQNVSCDYSVIGFSTAHALKQHNRKYHAPQDKIFVPESLRQHDEFVESTNAQQSAPAAAAPPTARYTTFANSDLAIFDALKNFDFDSFLHTDDPSGAFTFDNMNFNVFPKR